MSGFEFVFIYKFVINLRLANDVGEDDGSLDL